MISAPASSMQEQTDERKKELLSELHTRFVHASAEEHVNAEGTSLDAELAHQLAAGGAYWSCAALELLQQKQNSGMLAYPSVAQRVLALERSSGGFGGGAGHHAHAVHTLWALQALACSGSLQSASSELTARWLQSLQATAGWFGGDEWFERDARHTYCALASLVLINAHLAQAPLTSLVETRRLLVEHTRIDVDAAAHSVAGCQAYTGGFAAEPGLEPHAGHAFTCVMALALCNRLDLFDADALAWYLGERQCLSGGFNGRPEKLPDVCYSWWVLSSLAVLYRGHWIDAHALEQFMLNAQDADDGGFSDRPGYSPDTFHTYLALASLSLLWNGSDSCSNKQKPRLARVVPHLALPEPIVLNLTPLQQ